METSFIITFISDDRPGLVEELASAISAQGGNWLESRMAQLAGKFSGLIQVSLPGEKGDKLEAALKNLSDKGLSVRVTPVGSAPIALHAQRIIKLSIIGPDRPGIVREISSALALQQINVTDMHSSVHSGAMSAELMFSAEVEAEVPEHSDLEELADALDAISHQMLVDVHLSPS